MSPPAKPLVKAMIGVTISCSDPDAMQRICVDVLGWEIAARGKIDAALESCWGVAGGSAGAEFIVLRSPGTDRGMLRVVAGEDRVRSRPVAARWAGAEILITRDLDGLFEQLDRDRSFATLHRPFDMDWSEFGSNIHRAFLGVGPGGTHLVFTMALTQPAGRRFPMAGARVGHIFDVPLITGQFERSSRFYRQTLGMQPFLESRFDSGQWHALWQIPAGSPVALDILKGDAPGTGLGGIELQGYDGRLIDPEPACADRLDGGACMVTYSSTDVSAAYRAVTESPDSAVLSSPRSIGLPGYAGAHSFAFLGPDGERVEICDSNWVGERSE